MLAQLVIEIDAVLQVQLLELVTNFLRLEFLAQALDNLGIGFCGDLTLCIDDGQLDLDQVVQAVVHQLLANLLQLLRRNLAGVALQHVVDVRPHFVILNHLGPDAGDDARSVQVEQIELHRSLVLGRPQGLGRRGAARCARHEQSLRRTGGHRAGRGRDRARR